MGRLALALALLCLALLSGCGRPEPEAQPQLPAPRLIIQTREGNGVTLQKADGYVDALVEITDVDGTVTRDTARLKVRGNTTAMESVLKKSYTLKFPQKRNLLGLGIGRRWVLLANAFDPTLLRNNLANTLARELDLAYVPERTYAELWLDGAFRGCYEVYELVESGRDRLPLHRGQGDFLVEYEPDREDEPGLTFLDVGGLRFVLKEPEHPTPQELEQITAAMEDLVALLDEGTEAEIAKRVDVDSFVGYYLLNEYLKTFDFSKTSVFYYYQGGKLHAGPPWDYDFSTGNLSDTAQAPRYVGAVDPEGLYLTGKGLYRNLSRQEWFLDRVEAVYRAHQAFFDHISADGGLLDGLLEDNREIFQRNYSPGVWDVSKHWINVQKKPLPTYEQNYDFLKTWLQRRNAWLRAFFAEPNTTDSGGP